MRFASISNHAHLFDMPNVIPAADSYMGVSPQSFHQKLNINYSSVIFCMRQKCFNTTSKGN